ncbi:uncharacterized protein N7511_007846 [Penicillium nucicola]|uniref:uncharacterized protein n=1 Tax=Penicillium nucicola TaxID=1850975 RepID=UPI002544E425|nr:uncharacterized protein N7511_007846 [Penicillium nucicola]KAJ5753693.1 hypothetical protein N7511_007846 [Penicillium nucicola]
MDCSQKTAYYGAFAGPFELHKSGLILSGPENQAIRFLIRISRVRFTAINESGVPFLAELLTLAKSHRSIRNALLALADRLRTTAYSSTALDTINSQTSQPELWSPKTTALRSYQDALIGLQENIARLHIAEASHDVALEALGSVLLLTIAGFPRHIRAEGAYDWALHVTGMISLIESLDTGVTDGTGLGRLVKEMAAHLDIAVFSLGRPGKSRRAWLQWEIYPPGTRCQSDFSSLEIIAGYPKSLSTIIAAMSAVLEDMHLPSCEDSLQDIVRKLYDTTLIGQGTGSSVPGPIATPTDDTHRQMLNMLEIVLVLWQPPDLPTRISMPVALSLTSAWEIMRKAALLYLWRGGFCNSVFAPIFSDREDVTARFIREMLLGFRALLNLVDEQRITIMNVMTWPLLVVANECGNNPDLQGEILSLMQKTRQCFGIEHLAHLSTLLQELWRRYESYSHSPGMSSSSSNHLHLDKLSREFELCLPLL